MTLGPLDGFVVGITADRRWQEQAELLERRGAAILHGPTMTTQYLASDEDLRRATQAVLDEPPDYVVATTGIGMRAWLEAAAAWGLADALAGVLARARVVARGPKAAATVQAAGIEVWARSPTEQLRALVDLLLAEPLTGRRVVVQEYGAPNPEPTAALRAAGAAVVEVPVYRWRLPDDTAPALRLAEAACDGRVDAITFTSAPAVHNLFAIAARHGMDDGLRRACNGRVVVACVGPVCADGAVKEGIAEPLAPPVGRLGLLVRALSDRLGAERRTFSLGGTPVTLQGSAVEVAGLRGPNAVAGLRGPNAVAGQRGPNDVAGLRGPNAVAGLRGPNAVAGQRAELSPRERALFEALLDARGAVVARSALLERVWGSPSVDPHVLEVTVGRLRRRLGPAGAGLRAVAGRGYHLDGLGPDRSAAPL